MSTSAGFRPHLAIASLLLVGAAAACTTIIGAEDRYLSVEDASTALDRDATIAPDAAHDSPDAAMDSGPAPQPPVDAGLDAALDGGLDAEVAANIVPNPGFELGIVNGNCGTGWNYIGTGSLTTSPTAHGGHASCMICNETTNMQGFLALALPTPDAGSVIVPSAWLAAAPGTDGGLGTAAVGIGICSPGCLYDYSNDQVPQLPVAWTIDQGHQIVVPPGADPTFTVAVLVSDGCVLVDDMSVIIQ